MRTIPSPGRRRGAAALAASALLAAAILLAPAPLHAYGGPGSVITGLGALLAAVATIAAAIFGFLWFPLKRLTRKLRDGDGDGEGDGGDGAGGPDESAPPGEDASAGEAGGPDGPTRE